MTEIVTLLQAEGEAGHKITSEIIKKTANYTNAPLSQVASLATFYSMFQGQEDGYTELAWTDAGNEGALFAKADYETVKSLCRNPSRIIETVEESGICGCGGGGFPVASKWKISRDTPADQRYVICNCSEGEANTCKDFKLLTRAPHNIVSGIALCAAVVGATQAFIYVKSEYRKHLDALYAAVEEAIHQFSDLQIHIVEGSGCYVCGEETALLRYLSGERGEPALKPPFPGVEGLNKKPTVVNNAESFAQVTAYCRFQSKSKLYTVSGCVDRPGVYEMPFGVTPRDLAVEAGVSTQMKGFQLGGGTTGSILNAEFLDMPLTYVDCRTRGVSLGTASVTFLDGCDDVRALCQRCVAFLANQSCGKCVPCRFGSVELADMLARGARAEELSMLCSYLRSNCRCAFGQAIPNVVESALKCFPAEFN